MFNKKLKFALLGVAVALIIVMLGYFAIGGSFAYQITVAELLAKKSEMVDKPLRVAGVVRKGTISYSAQTAETRFVMEDKRDKSKAIRVVYAKPVPDTFGPQVEVVVDGTYSSDGVFTADSLLTKCASKYESKKE